MKKKRIKIFVVLLIAVLSYLFFSNWEDFKAGFFGEPFSNEETR